MTSRAKRESTATTARLGLVRSPAVPLDTASTEVPQHHLGFPHAAEPAVTGEPR